MYKKYQLGSDDMAKEKINPYDYSLKLRLKTDKTFFGPGVVELLLLIDKTKSINASAKEMKMSYNKSWRIIHDAEKVLEFPLIQSKVGGTSGGGTVVTDEGKKIIEKFTRFQEEVYSIADDKFKKIFFEE